MNPQESGFTLIELMIVVAIMSIVLAIALPRMGDLIAKSEEAVTKGNLGAMRSAIAIYYADNEGVYPRIDDRLAQLTINGKYLQVIPMAYFPHTTSSPGHRPSNRVIPNLFANGTYPGHLNMVGAFDFIFGGGGWSYNASDQGEVDVTAYCGHKDLRGQVWATN